MLLSQEDKKIIKFKIEKELKSICQQKVKLDKLIKNNQSIVDDYKKKLVDVEEEIKNLEFLVEKIK